jgi:hypothetical protein
LQYNELVKKLRLDKFKFSDAVKRLKLDKFQFSDAVKNSELRTTKSPSIAMKLAREWSTSAPCKQKHVLET